MHCCILTWSQGLDLTGKVREWSKDRRRDTEKLVLGVLGPLMEKPPLPGSSATCLLLTWTRRWGCCRQINMGAGSGVQVNKEAGLAHLHRRAVFRSQTSGEKAMVEFFCTHHPHLQWDPRKALLSFWASPGVGFATLVGPRHWSLTWLYPSVRQHHSLRTSLVPYIDCIFTKNDFTTTVSRCKSSVTSTPRQCQLIYFYLLPASNPGLSLGDCVALPWCLGGGCVGELSLWVLGWTWVP